MELDRVALEFHPLGGQLRNVVFRDAHGRDVRPLHTAPWVDSGESLPDDLALVERRLSGDFFCAPFGGSTDGTPIHGWTANGHWQHCEEVDDDTNGNDGNDGNDGNRNEDDSLSVCYRLTEPVMGARVTKVLTLRRGHPVLYQRHVFDGGRGHLPVAHHAMLRVPGGASLAFSAKQFGRTPATALEPDATRGRSRLAYPQQFAALDEVMLASGQRVDASHYPFADAHEDLLVLAERTPASLAWSAALAVADGFLFFAIKDARTLPETILWMSNGGRDYAPWSGRHTAVLGIEEAATAMHANGELVAATSDISPHGLPTGLSLSPTGQREIAYAFGAIPAPTGWTRIRDIRIDTTMLTLEDVGGDSVTVPFDAAHFGA